MLSLLFSEIKIFNYNRCMMTNNTLQNRVLYLNNAADESVNRSWLLSNNLKK